MREKYKMSCFVLWLCQCTLQALDLYSVCKQFDTRPGYQWHYIWFTSITYVFSCKWQGCLHIYCPFMIMYSSHVYDLFSWKSVIMQRKNQHVYVIKPRRTLGTLDGRYLSELRFDPLISRIRRKYVNHHVTHVIREKRKLIRNLWSKRYWIMSV